MSRILSSFALSTLILSTAYATNAEVLGELPTSMTSRSDCIGDLSGAYNDPVLQPANFQHWHTSYLKKFQTKMDGRFHLVEQAKRYFEPYCREGTNEDRARANAVIKFLEARAEKAEYALMFFKSYSVNGAPNLKANWENDGPIQVKKGIFAGLLKKMRGLSCDMKTKSKELSKKQSQIETLLSGKTTAEPSGQNSNNDDESNGCVQWSDSDKESEALDEKSSQKQVMPQDSSDEINTLRQEIEDIKSALEVSKKEFEKVKLQASLHAFVKYITHLNILCAIPCDHWDKESRDQLQVLAGGDRHAILSLFDSSDRKKREKVLSASKGLIMSHSKYKEGVLAYINAATDTLKKTQGLSNRDHNNLKDPLAAAVEYTKNQDKMDTETIGKHKQSMDEAFQPLADEDFNEIYSEISSQCRLDQVLLRHISKWQNRIHLTDDSSVMFSGLLSSLLKDRTAFSATRDILSFEGVLREPQVKCENVYGAKDLLLHQLTSAYSDELMDSNPEVIARIKPIKTFIESKFFSGDLPTVFENEFHALFMTASYLSMYDALSYTCDRQSAKDIAFIDPKIMPFLRKESLNEKELAGLKSVIADQALRWGRYLEECGSDFINKNGLRAWLFDKNLTSDEVN